MKNIITAGKLLLVLLFLMFADTKNNVWICTSSKAYAYHRTSNCKPLQRCKSDIKKISESKAIDMGRRKCKLCYKSEEPKDTLTDTLTATN